MTNISAIFLKQIIDTFKNKAVLIQFLLFPTFAIIMENGVKIDDMPEHFFVKLFAVMFVGMAPLTCISSIISEEKEKNTLRALLMSNVRPAQYLFGVGSYIWIMCMIGALVFALCGKYSGNDFIIFMLIMGIGVLLSILIGAVIGICCKNQMASTSITVPVMMIFSFLPMISMFNESIEKVAKITYSQQISLLINSIGTANIGTTKIEFENIAIILANLLLAIICFIIAFKKKGLE